MMHAALGFVGTIDPAMTSLRRNIEMSGVQMKRTSMTHPLEIAAVSAGPTFGRVGITFCPGKYDRHAMSGYWDRDLSLDLDAIRDWGAAAVASLL